MFRRKNLFWNLLLDNMELPVNTDVGVPGLLGVTLLVETDESAWGGGDEKVENKQKENKKQNKKKNKKKTKKNKKRCLPG